MTLHEARRPRRGALSARGVAWDEALVILRIFFFQEEP